MKKPYSKIKADYMEIEGEIRNFETNFSKNSFEAEKKKIKLIDTDIIIKEQHKHFNKVKLLFSGNLTEKQILRLQEITMDNFKIAFTVLTYGIPKIVIRFGHIDKVDTKRTDIKELKNNYWVI